MAPLQPMPSRVCSPIMRVFSVYIMHSLDLSVLVGPRLCPIDTAYTQISPELVFVRTEYHQSMDTFVTL